MFGRRDVLCTTSLAKAGAGLLPDRSRKLVNVMESRGGPQTALTLIAAVARSPSRGSSKVVSEYKILMFEHRQS